MTTSLNRTEGNSFKQWLPGLVVLAALVMAYWTVVEGMVQQWLHNED
jgi:hypothetical protein